jgi:hypothetical protein
MKKLGCVSVPVELQFNGGTRIQQFERARTLIENDFKG